MRRLAVLAAVAAVGLAAGGFVAAAADGRAAASADLQLTAPLVPSTGTVGFKLRYFFSVENAGPDETGGVLTITIPSSYQRTSGQTFGGPKCEGATIIMCRPLGGVFPSTPSNFGHFTLWVIPTETGRVTVQAKVEGDVPDPNPADNEVSITTSVSAAARLTATIGPGKRLMLTKANGSRVRTIKAGNYEVLVRDRSASNNFHLTGPGVNKKTGIAQRTTVTWRLVLKAGLYRYRSDAKPRLGATFRVT
jgi:hypothetical protein